MAGWAPNSEGQGLPKAKLMADINITPMVDVMLVLLVIFIVTAPLLMAGVRVDMPRTAAPKISPIDKPTIVTMTVDGGLYLGDDPIARDALEGQLSALRGGRGDAVIYIKADRKIPYGDVLELLGQVEHSGYQRISLVSQAGPASPPAAVEAPNPK